MITSKCNLECPFCFSFDRKDLSTKKNIEIAGKIISFGVRKVVISGGEPLYRKDIIKIINYLKSKKLTIRLDTNGLLLAKYLDRLKNIDAVGISLDGPDPATDQSMRKNPKHFESVIKALEKLKKTQIRIFIHTLATKLNYSSLKYMSGLLENYPIKSWVIFEYCPYGLAYKNRDKFELKPGQFEKFKKMIKYKGKINFCRIKDRTKAYYFINSDGSIYTQPKKFQFDYPVFGNILIEKNPQKFFLKISQINNRKRSRIF